MTRARTNADQAHTESLSVEPHIIPGVVVLPLRNQRKDTGRMTCEQCDHDPCECEDWILKQDYHDNDNNENEKE